MPVHATLTSGIIPSTQLGSGTPDGTKFLRDDGTWAVPAGGSGSTVISGTGIITVPSPGRFEWEETITVTGALSSHKVFITIGAHTDEDENHESGLNIQSIGAVPTTNQIYVSVSFGELTSGQIKLNYMVA